MNALQELQNLMFQRQCERHPLFPQDYMTQPKVTDKTANGLTKCIIAWLELHGWQAERIVCQGTAVAKKSVNGKVVGIDWRESHMTVGTADISATINGRSVKIEVKVGRDRQSEAQRQYQQAVESAGGLYYIARDFQSFVEWCRTTKF